MSDKKKVMEHDPLAEMGNDDDPQAVSAEQDDAQETAAVSDVGVLDFEQSLTIAEVGELRETLLIQCDTENTLNLKGGDIESIDGAGLQFLASLVKEATEMHIVITWIDASDELKKAAESVGLAGVLGLDDVVTN